MLPIPFPSEGDARAFFQKSGINVPSNEELQQLEGVVVANKAEAKGLAIKGTPAIVINDTILYGWNPKEFSDKVQQE